MRKSIPLTCLLLASLALAACDLAPPPKADPDTSAAAREAAKHHELKEGIESIDHRDKAAAAGDAVLEADKRREQVLKDAGG